MLMFKNIVYILMLKTFELNNIFNNIIILSQNIIIEYYEYRCKKSLIRKSKIKFCSTL